MDVAERKKSIEAPGSEVNNISTPSRWIKIVQEAKKRYKISLLFDMVNLGLSVSCCAMYIYSTYDPCSLQEGLSYFWYNFLCRMYFLIDFVLNMFTVKSDKKLYYLSYFIVETSTIMPYMLTRVISGMKEDFTDPIYLITNSLIALRIFRVQYLVKYIQSEVNKKLYTILVSILSLLIFATAIINVVENTQTVGKYTLFLPRDCPNNLCIRWNESFHSTFFFVLTTVATIGYFSNIYSGVGRLLIISLIIASLIEIPSKCSELMNLLASKSIFSRTTYKELDKVNYILITGNISYSSMVDLLQEYFHSDHGESERHALILMPNQPDSNMKSLLQEYQNKLYYFEGDPLKESDLKRCQFQNASTIILLCNKQTDDSNAEDSKTILQAMAIRKYLVQEQETNRKDADTKMLIQLLRPESELHFALSISKKNNSDQILCIDELKLSLLAKSCLCQGIISLVSNLIMTSNLDNINVKLLEKNRWLDEYKKGKGYEIYKVQLDYMRGYSFSEICDMVYKEKNIILFGLNIEAKDDGTSIVLLNPYDFVLPMNIDVYIFGYCLAENRNDADDVYTWSHSQKKANVLVPDSTMTVFKEARKSYTRRSTIFHSDKFNEPMEEESPSIDDKENNELYSTDAITFSKICHITTEPIDKAAVTMENIDSMLIAKDHIIICGISQNFIDFIKPLRAKYLPKSECPTIVILSKELPDEKIWSTIAFFDQIYLVKGDPMNKGDLYRAGIKSAKKVVILAPRIQEITRFTNRGTNVNSSSFSNSTKGDVSDTTSKTARKLTREEENLLDSKTIFKYNMISKIKKDIFIVIELINPKNVAFLYNKGRTQNDEYSFIKSNMNIDGTASFAAGEVYFSSIMDNLVIQAYYNPSLLAVLKKLILGEDQSAYKKAPLNRYKDIVSSNLYLIDLPSQDNKFFNISETNSTRAFQEQDMFIRRINFKEVFQAFLKQKIIVVGVYRSSDMSKTSTYGKSYSYSNFLHVVTSPDPDFELNPRDKLFVLSQDFPEQDNIFGTVKKENMEQFNDNILKQYEKVQYSKFNKKNEEKKENLKVFDDIGEMKIKEVNTSLKDTLDHLRTLKSTIDSVKDKIDKVLPDLIKKKISGVNDHDIKKSNSDGSQENSQMD